MSEIALSVDCLAKRFRQKVAVDDISFAIPKGSICGLVGPNGAGKTTILRILLDLVRPDSGTVRVLGLDPARSALDILARVGYVPEKHHIYQWMRVQQVLDFAAGIYPRWDWDECKQVNEILGLPIDRKVNELSRGELAKLALIVALGHKPELLVLDEPTSGLDPLIRREFLTAIVGLLKDANRTVFFSTHILSDVERIADRVIVMNEGNIVADDTLDALRNRFSRVSLLFDAPPGEEFEVAGARRVDKGVREWVAVFEGEGPDLAALTSGMSVADASIQPMTLEDVFIELIAKKENGE